MVATSFKLNNGLEMPAVGLGTWQSKAGEVQTAVSYALQNGYKLIDGAYCYGNEGEVGEGLKEAFAAGVKREDVFVVTKVWATYSTRVAESLGKSLKSLGLEWPDLLPWTGNHDKFPTLPDGRRDVIRDYNHVHGWGQMEAALQTGKTRAIGVSNQYSKGYLQQLLAHAAVVPAVNQIENHPSLPQQEIVDFCKEKGIHVMAYSPLGSSGSPLMGAEPVVKIAEKRGVSAGTVLLSYHVNRGSTVLAKSVTPARIKANLEIIGLDDEDTKLLNDYSDDLATKGKLKRYVYPPFGIDFGFPDKS
ncbi:d-galacturonic acid reductase [Trichoderma cornu-damae]|uniref:D-galacturonic acid reductase n=1 Tax=Trichoderma cornu-damae TaxID=654480 RepID=A0A9P8QL34_9HYPO|nr:d-galacturonic acid reductase [Trichoderma cornu-damae]